MATSVIWETVFRVVELAGTWGIVLVLYRELEAVRKQGLGENVRTLFELLQRDDIREARKLLLNAKREKQLDAPPGKWPQPLRDAAEKTAFPYDLVGLLVEKRWIPEKLLFPAWAPSIFDSWEAAAPLIEKQREDYGDPVRWRRFQLLAHMAKKYLHRPTASS